MFYRLAGGGSRIRLFVPPAGAGLFAPGTSITRARAVPARAGAFGSKVGSTAIRGGLEYALCCPIAREPSWCQMVALVVATPASPN
jgi:hypothetical protein